VSARAKSALVARAAPRLFAWMAAWLLASAGFALAQSAPANRLALVVGEANYGGDELQTVAADASLVAQALAGSGFDVDERHDLDAAALASETQGFIAKVRAAPAGAAVTVYLAGLAANVGCDDYLIPVGTPISAAGDVTRIGLSMTRLMNELARTSAKVRLVMLDGARPIPKTLSAVNFARGLVPLDPPPATAFGLSAEIHDLENPPRPTDVTGAYATAVATVLQEPLADLESTLREIRLAVHQATGGAQTPWHATHPSTPAFVFPETADASDIESAMANLPSATAPLASLDAQDAYWAAIWRNSAADYQAYLSAFSGTAPGELLARARELIDLLKLPNPECVGSSTPPPPPPPEPALLGPPCPDGFFPEDGFNGAYCVPFAPPPALVCPAGFASVATTQGFACASLAPQPALLCPIGFHAAAFACAPDVPLLNCPQGFHPIAHGGRLTCVRNGPPPPGCPAGGHPGWTGEGWACVSNPQTPPIPCANGKAIYSNGQWACIAGAAAGTPCPNGQTPIFQNGQRACGVVRPQTSCPAGFAAAGSPPVCVRIAHGQTCAPGAACPAPIRCLNGAVFVAGKGCAASTPAPEAVNPKPVSPLSAAPSRQTPTRPVLEGCPSGEALQGGACVPLKREAPTVQPAPEPQRPALRLPPMPAALQHIASPPPPNPPSKPTPFPSHPACGRPGFSACP